MMLSRTRNSGCFRAWLVSRCSGWHLEPRNWPIPLVFLGPALYVFSVYLAVYLTGAGIFLESPAVMLVLRSHFK